MAKAPTSVTNPDGSVTETTYDAQGNPYVVSTTKTASDGSRTETRQFATGEVDQLRYGSDGKFLGTLSQNPDGTLTVALTSGGGNTRTTYSADGTTPLNRVTYDPTTGDQTTDYLNPDGSVNRTTTKTAEQIRQDQINEATAQDVANNTGKGVGNWLLNPTAAKKDISSGVKDLKSITDQFNPVGTPGVNNPAVTDRLLGGDHANDPIFTDDTAGSILKTIAGYYGLGGLVGGSGGTSGIGGSGSLSGVTSGLASDVAASRDLRSMFSDAYNKATPGTAPVITPTLAKDPTLATYLAQQPISRATAGQVGAIPQVVAPTIGAAPSVQAGTATAGVATPASSIAVTLAQAAQAKADQAKATLLDPTQQAEFRAQQKTLAGYLNDAILGNAPSVAELQLREAEQRQEANQLGLAAKASGGGNLALALRTAANNIGRLNQGASADAALLRAKEIADARGQLGDVVSSGRNSDINLAGQNATLATDVSKLNAGLNTDVSKTNAGLTTDVSKLNASNQTDASKTLAQLLTQANIANAGNQTQASVATAGNQTQASAATAQNITTLLAKKAELEYQASHDNAGNALSAQETQAKLATDVSLAAALAQNTADLQTQRVAADVSQTNAKNTTDTNINNAKFTNDAASSNATNTLKQRELDEKTKQDAAANTLSAGDQAIKGGSAAADAAARVDAANRQGLAALGTGLATWLSSGKSSSGSSNAPNYDSNQSPTISYDQGTTSDRRAKTDVADGEDAAQSILDALSPKSYRYKDDARGPGVSPGRKVGVMAQDLEKTRAGKKLVGEGPGGKKLIKGGEPTSTTLMAMLATLNKRMDRMEGRHA